jgi:hypothetical protein
MSPVPAREGVVDGMGELNERVRAGGCEHAARPGPEALAVAFD